MSQLGKDGRRERRMVIVVHACEMVFLVRYRRAESRYAGARSAFIELSAAAAAYAAARPSADIASDRLDEALKTT